MTITCMAVGRRPASRTAPGRLSARTVGQAEPPAGALSGHSLAKYSGASYSATPKQYAYTWPCKL